MATPLKNPKYLFSFIILGSDREAFGRNDRTFGSVENLKM